jgi:putative PIN family toxin of toxin-antitoxin system
VKRVTPDSNVLVSALVFGGKPLEILELGLDGQIELAVSDFIVAETLRILRDKLTRSPEQLTKAESYIDGCAKRVSPTHTLDVVKTDPSENQIIECAVAAGSEVVVTGDAHLLSLGGFRGIKMMRVADFLQRGRGR